MDQMLVIVDQFPVEFNLEAVGRKLRLQPGQNKFTDRLARLAEEARAIARPKAAAKLCGLTVLNDEQVGLNGVTFTSSLLIKNMGQLGRAFPYLATEGLEMADWALSLSSSLDKVFSNSLREAAVKLAEGQLEKKLVEQYGMGQVSAMNPGSLALWPLTQQEQLFQVLAPFPENLGVTLLPSFMMAPEHVISGIFFQTETKYFNCQLCPQAECPNRKAPSTVI